jgi:peptidoglycan-N-acetylglucosamine deacetylase
MQRTYKSSPAPRYFTIKIQYYPLDKRVFFLPLYLISVVVLAYIVHYTLTETTFFSPSVIGYEKPLTREIHPAEEIAALIPVSDVNNRAGQVIFHGSRDEKEIALTFDADMTPGMKKLLDDNVVPSFYDKRITDYLTKTHTKATLFLSGMWIEQYPDETKALAENPLFELANHSYSHPSFAGDCYGLEKIPDSENQDQMERTQGLLAHETKKQNTLFRFPGGCYSPADLESAKESGLAVIQWDVAGEDGFNNDPSAIVQNVVPNVRNGSIIVLHMSGGPNAPKTMDALPQIVERLKEKGYDFVTVSDLFDPQPVANPTEFPFRQY